MCSITNHVLLRDQAKSSTSLTKKGLLLQIPCLIELINLVDVQTKNKAYLLMDSVESMYISMLGGEEEAKKHSPTLTRKWLKDQVLSELPSVKSVRQKDCRKALVLYSPESCEEDMVHISMVDTTSEMDNTKMLYKTAKLIRNNIETHIDEKSQSDFIEVSSSRDDVPSQLYTLIRWILVGQQEELQTEMRTRTVDHTALTISQNIMYAYKTKRQVKYKPTANSEPTR